MSAWPFVVGALAVLAMFAVQGASKRISAFVLPLATATLFVVLWQISCEFKSYEVRTPSGGTRVVWMFPTPWMVLQDAHRPLADGTLLRHAIASVVRVGTGFTAAVVVGVPIGLWTGWSLRAGQALDPLSQGLRPISPLAWIPVAIVWFGIDDMAAIFLVFLASVFVIITGTATAVRSIPRVYVRTAQNFGLEGIELFRRVVFPACLPQIVGSLRLALGIAWLVVVAAEMIAVSTGLGYLITDSRNASNMERVVVSMVAIGLIGVGLDFLMRRLERLDSVRWGFSKS